MQHPIAQGDGVYKFIIIIIIIIIIIMVACRPTGSGYRDSHVLIKS